MPRKTAKKTTKKSSKKGARKPGARAAATEEEIAAAIAEAEEAQTDDDEEEEEEEVDFDNLAPDEQQAFLAAAADRGEDVSILRSRVNAKERRDWSKVAELVRLSPDYDEDDVKISGLVRRFNAPFNDLKIREYALKQHGGGEYAILYYDRNHQIAGREAFEVSGRTKSARETESLHAHEPEEEKPVVSEVHGARIGGFGAPSSRESELERQMAEMRHQQEIDRMRADHRSELRDMNAKIDAVAAAPKTNGTAELLTALGVALAPFAPALIEKLGTKSKDNLKEMMTFMQQQDEKHQQQIKDLLVEKKTNDPMANATTKMLDLAIAGVLGPKKDPEQLMYKMMETMIPNITEQALSIATMNMEKGEDSGPMAMIEKFGDMVKPLLGGMGGGGGAPPPQMPGYPPGYPQAPAVPMAAPPAPPGAQAGAWPYSGAPAAPVPQAAPPQPVLPPQAPGPQAQPVAPTAPGQQPVAPTAGQDYDIHPQLFILTKQWVDQGKDGTELAEMVDKQLEAVEAGQSPGPRFLSEDAIRMLEQYEPATLVDHFFAAAPAELLLPLHDPSGAIAPHIKAFVIEFCDFFYSDDDESEEDDAPETNPAAVAPTAPAAPSAPAAPQAAAPTAPVAPVAPAAPELTPEQIQAANQLAIMEAAIQNAVQSGHRSTCSQCQWVGAAGDLVKHSEGDYRCPNGHGGTNLQFHAPAPAQGGTP